MTHSRNPSARHRARAHRRLAPTERRCARLAKVVVLAIVAWSLPATAAAAPVYTFNHFIDTYNSSALAANNPGQQSSPIDYDFAYQSVHWQDKNFGEVHGHVHAGSLGIYAHAYNNGLYAPQRQEVGASFTFDVMFASPTSDPVDVVMNLALSGTISPPGGFRSTVSVAAGAQGINPASGGQFSRSGTASPATTSSGMLAGFVDDGSVQTISTAVMSVPVNVPVTMFIALSTVQPYHNANPVIDFGHTVSLASGGDVFTLLGPNAAGVTVDSVDAGIVDNQFVAAVPLPGAAWLLAGVVLPLLRRRRG